MANIHEIIPVVSPDTYCQESKEDTNLREYVRKLVKEKGYGQAIEEMSKGSKVKLSDLKLKPGELPLYNYDDAKADAFNLWGLKSPIEKHEIIYDSPTEGLEPIYFWLLDFVNEVYRTKVEKITDNFVSSPGSSHFSELQGKATQMQQEVSRTMGNINTVIKSVLNLVYDLKEFNLRLKPYDDYKKANAGTQEKFNKLLSLKQVWLDNVDIKKGRGSINALASGELDFATLRDAFMALESLEQIMKKSGERGSLDLNERVRRILQQRAQEFFDWIEESNRSLRQRYEIEKNYLRSQINMLKLYARWVKPYLKASQKLEQADNKSAELVTAFNTVIFELVILANSKYDTDDDVAAGLLPDIFKKIKKESREYSKILVLEFGFRSIPQKVSQRGEWGFGGRAKITFTSYALNDQELKVIEDELKKDDFNSVMKLIEGATDNSLKEIQKDIDELLGDNKEKKEVKPILTSEDTNPFKALFSGFKFNKKEKKVWKLGDIIEPDNDYEKVMRSQTAISARETCFTIFDVFKKSKGMPSHADPTTPL